MQPPGAATSAAHTAAQPGQGVALTDAVVVGLAASEGDAVAVAAALADALADALAVTLADGVGVGWQASQQAPWLVALPRQSHTGGQVSRPHSSFRHTPARAGSRRRAWGCAAAAAASRRPDAVHE